MFRKRKITNILALVLVFNLAFAGMCSRDNRTKKLSKAVDDFAEAQVSVANLFAKAKENGTISQEAINEIKPFLQHANDLNEEAIKYGRTLLKNPTDTATQSVLVDVINQISSTLVRANNAGFLRIKNEGVRAAFSALIVVMQAAVTSAIGIIKR